MRNFLFKWGVTIGLIAGSVMQVFSQESNMIRAQQVYQLLVADEADSIHSMLNADLQQKLSAQMFKGMIKQTERQFGKLQSKGEWQKESAQNITLYHSDLKFERYTLRLLLSFDGDGGMNTIRLMPAPAPSTAQPIAYNKEKMTERDVTVGSEGFSLPGTLTLPLNKNKSPLLILVHGSGPQDRDETIGPNKPFRDLAWALAEHGIATIRYEKRTKVYGAASIPQGREMDYDTETVDDAVAISHWATTLAEVAADSIYVLGHSLGATLAPRIAQRSPHLAGIVLLAGMARQFEDLIVEQMTYISSLTNASDNEKKQLEEIKKQAANVKKIGTPQYDESIPLLLNIPASYWKLSNEYRPVEVAAQLSLPILVLQGERDYQVTMADYGLWRLGLMRNRNAFFKSYPKLNHLMQEGSGMSTPFEYNQKSPVAQYVMDDIATFVRSGRLL